MGKSLNLIGKRFGRLSVVGKEEGTGRSRWVCICDCGVTKSVVGSYLTSTRSPVRSCGCLQKETAASMRTTHGDSSSRLYNIWRGMHARCKSNAEQNVNSYRGKGIVVCEEWESYTVFKEWAESSGYSDDLSIEREDISVGYSPDNCTWIPLGDQARNRGVYSNNTTGHQGVVYLNPKEGTKRSPSYAAIWNENGKPKKRSFSIAKYGEDQAFQLAVTTRREQINRLKSEGVYYGVHH